MLESGQVRIFTGSKESFADVIYYESSSIRYMWVGGWGWVEDFWWLETDMNTTVFSAIFLERD